MSEVVEMKKPYAIWRIGEEEYKLKLTTAAIVELETRYKVNLLELLRADTSTSVPPLSVMLDVVHAALQKYHHGIKKADVYDMFDRYEEKGGSQLKFYASVFIDLYTVSGFFGEKMAEDMRANLQEMEDSL
jgi:hypothetical protein